MTEIITDGSYSIYTTRGRARYDKRRFEQYLDKKLTLDTHLYFQWLTATGWIKEGRTKYHQLVLIYPEFTVELEQYFIQLLKDYPERVRADLPDPRLTGTLAGCLKAKPVTYEPVSFEQVMQCHPTKGKAMLTAQTRQERQKEAIANAKEEAKDKKEIEDAEILRLTIRSAYHKTKNYPASDPKKMTIRRLMLTYSMTLQQITSIIG